MLRLLPSLAVIACLLTTGASRGLAAPGYVPPVTHEDRTDVSIWFARIKATGKWCQFDSETMAAHSKREDLVPGEFGWARFDGRHLKSVTYAQQSEDAYVEDRYYLGSKNQVQKMVRTGHYITAPWVSVTFQPDGAGRLRLSSASKSVIQKMTADGQETYFVDWDHFSRLSQLPFGKFLNRQSGQAASVC